MASKPDNKYDDQWLYAKIEVALQRERCGCFMAIVEAAHPDSTITISYDTAVSIASVLYDAGHPMPPNGELNGKRKAGN